MTAAFHIDDDRDVIPAVVERPASDAINDVLALDDELARLQALYLAETGMSASMQSVAAHAAVKHGLVTDLRERIVAWVERERDEAARLAEEDRADV